MSIKSILAIVLPIILTPVLSTELPASSHTGVLDLTWTDNSNNEDGFTIERKTGTNGAFARIATLGPNITSYTDSGLTVGTTYCYRMNAFNSGGASSYSSEDCAVARLSSSAFSFSITSDGNKSVTQGQSISTTVTATLSSGSSQPVSFLTSGLPAGALASYSQTSCNLSCSTRLTIATSPSTPRGTYTLIVTGTAKGIRRTTNFNLTVNATPPTFNFSLTHGGNKSVTEGKSASSTITASLNAGSSQPVSFSTSGVPTGATASYSPTSCILTCSSNLTIATSTATPKGTYTISIVGKAGGITQITSFNLTVNASTAAILTLTWMDNSGDENGFTIERKNATTGTFSQIATVGDDLEFYTDSGLTVGSTYCYRVNAFSSIGASHYSNEACGVAQLP